MHLCSCTWNVRRKTKNVVPGNKRIRNHPGNGEPRRKVGIKEVNGFQFFESFTGKFEERCKMRDNKNKKVRMLWRKNR